MVRSLILGMSAMLTCKSAVQRIIVILYIVYYIARKILAPDFGPLPIRVGRSPLVPSQLMILQNSLQIIGTFMGLEKYKFIALPLNVWPNVSVRISKSITDTCVFLQRYISTHITWMQGLKYVEINQRYIVDYNAWPMPHPIYCCHKNSAFTTKGCSVALCCSGSGRQTADVVPAWFSWILVLLEAPTEGIWKSI